MTAYVPSPTPADWTWLEPAIVAADVLKPGEARTRVFEMVRAGWQPMIDRLLALTTDSRAPVRRTTLELLDSLSSGRPGWPVVADVAERALTDPDPAVRRTASWLLVTTAPPERPVAALNDATDPAVRVALLDAVTHLPGHRTPLDRLRTDPVPAVRLLAHLALFDRDDPTAWPALDAAIRADLEPAAGDLAAPGFLLPATPGERWSWKLIALGREEDCYTWVNRLTGPDENVPVQREGVRMARAAMCEWRAGPARTTPALTALLGTGAHEAAVHALTASTTASHLAADHLAALLDDPELGPTAAIGLGAAGDHRATPRLAQMMLDGVDEPRLTEAFRALARTGADPAEPVAAARQILAAHPNTSEPASAMRMLAAFGPAAAAAVPELVARTRNAENDTPDWALHVLGRIGPAAAAAVPELPDWNRPLITLRVTQDRAAAERHLAARPEVFRRGRAEDAEMLTWLAEHGELTDRQHRQLRDLFGKTGFPQLYAAHGIWLHEGPAAAAELTATLTEYLSDDFYGPIALRTLGAMGEHARPALARLDDFVARRRRAGYNIPGGDDAEMRADEKMLAAVLAARAKISCGRATW